MAHGLHVWCMSMYPKLFQYDKLAFAETMPHEGEAVALAKWAQVSRPPRKSVLRRHPVVPGGVRSYLLPHEGSPPELDLPTVVLAVCFLVVLIWQPVVTFFCILLYEAYDLNKPEHDVSDAAMDNIHKGAGQLNDAVKAEYDSMKSNAERFEAQMVHEQDPRVEDSGPMGTEYKIRHHDYELRVHGHAPKSDGLPFVESALMRQAAISALALWNARGQCKQRAGADFL